MASTRQGGPGLNLPPTFPVINRLATAGVQSFQASGPISLAAGQAELVPAGQFNLLLGAYTFLQVYDPITTTWRTIGTQNMGVKPVNSDGANFRIVNLSGCAAGAFITNVGSGYTSAPTVTASAGSSAWTAVVGGAVHATVTITAAGSGYTYAPTLLVDAPPAGGVQATMTCTISAGAINAVTVVNQGAGYTTAPGVTILPDPRDTAGSGGTLTTTLTGSGTVCAVVCTNHGTAVTAVPTLTFAGGGGASAAATAVMCFTTPATQFTVDAGGVAYGNAQPFAVLAVGGVVAGAAGAVVNPALGPGLFTPRTGVITGTSTAGGAITATGAVTQDGGIFQAVPKGIVIAGGSGLATTVGQVTMGVGGVTDTSYLYPT